MQAFSFYVLNANGAYEAPRTLQGDSGEAFEIAHTLARRFGGCDVWQGNRRVLFVSFAAHASARAA